MAAPENKTPRAFGQRYFVFLVAQNGNISNEFPADTRALAEIFDSLVGEEWFPGNNPKI